MTPFLRLPTGNSLAQMPMELSDRTWLYDWHDLHLALGAEPNPMPGVVPVNAAQFGWFYDSHSFFLGSNDGSTDPATGKTNDSSMPYAWSWYQKVFVKDQGVALGSSS